MRNYKSPSFLASSLSLLLFASVGTLAACGGGGDDSGSDSDAGPFISLESVSPDRGPQAGGNVVTVTGTGFLLIGSERNQVLVGGALAEAVSVVSDTQLEVTVPSSDTAGAVGITVFNGNGTSGLGDVYTYNDQPTLEEASPERADSKGGETITLSGSGFESFDPGTNRVFFDGTEGTDVEVTNDGELTVTAPPGLLNPNSNVVVTNNNGSTDPLAFRYDGSGLIAFGHSRRGGPLTADTVAGNDGQIFLIDPISKTIEETSMALEGVDASPINTCRAATVGNDAIFAREQEGGLVRHDIEAGTTEGPVILDGCNRLFGLEFHQGVLYGFCRDNQNGQDFGRVDPVANTFTPIGSNEDCCRFNLISNGTTLFLHDENLIGTIDPLTGAKGPQININGNGSSIRGMSFHDGVFYAISTSVFGGPPGNDQTFLLSIDPATGNTDFVMTLGSGLRGLATLQ